MGQPSRVLYLPPGVTPGPTPGQPAQQVVMPSGIPFDRGFFEQVLPHSVAAFCAQVNCPTPIVELLTTDGTTHYVKGIAGVSDSWVALHTMSPDHEHDVQVFIPFQTIFRVEVHPESDELRKRLGFVLTATKVNTPEIDAQAKIAAAAAPKTQAVARKKPASP